MTNTFVEAQHTLGFPSRLFNRARNRIVALYFCFEKGTSPPRRAKSTGAVRGGEPQGHPRRSIEVGTV